MTSYTITYHQAIHHKACEPSLKAMGKALGGWSEYGRSTPIPLTRVLDVLGTNDALWALTVVDERAARLLASDYAAHVHDVWDAAYPDDTRPADAIRAVRAWAAGKSTTEERIRAARAARDAGDARDARAARAARDAERGWQVRHTRAVLTGKRDPGTVRIRQAKRTRP